MERMELVEKLRERASISMEEARDVLERNNWDILDAMVELERAGKINGGAEASTQKEAPEYENVVPTVSRKEEKKARRKEKSGTLKEKLCHLIRVLLDNKFVIKKKDGEEMFRIPTLLLIICALAAIWLTVIVLVVGLIFGLRYSFEGKELGTQQVNDGIAKVSEYTQDLVNNITGKGGNDESGEK